MRNLILAFTVCLISACGSSTFESTNTHTLDQYLEVKDALVATDFDATQEAAKQMFNDELPTELKGPLTAIANSATIAEQRVAFEDLSIQMYQIVSSQPIEGQMIYKQYCPMAFNNSGAFWLSTEEQIMNPYFGDIMLYCGAVQETIQ